jgi:hypothetical protein
MVSRKNGDVPMTRQRATSDPRRLGMTFDDGTVGRYSEVSKPTPNTSVRSDDPEYPTGLFKIYETKKTRLCLHYTADRNCFWFVEMKYGQQRHSITYGSKDRALQVLRQDKVRWKRPGL